MRFSRQCCWGLKPCGIQWCVDLWRHQRFILYYRLHVLDQAVQELRLLGPVHEGLTLKTKNYDPSKSRKLFRTRHVVQYVASFLAGGELCGAGGRANVCCEGAGGVTSVWKGQLYLRRRRGLDQTWRSISDSLLAYRSKIPPAKNRALHCNVPKTWNIRTERNNVGNRAWRTVRNTRQLCITKMLLIICRFLGHDTQSDRNLPTNRWHIPQSSVYAAWWRPRSLQDISEYAAHS
jgi:hypothetical protein